MTPLTKELETIVAVAQWYLDQEALAERDYRHTIDLRILSAMAREAVAQAPALLARVKGMEAVNRAIGVACLEHDLVHYIKCGHCYEKLEAELATLKAQQGAVIEAIMAEIKDETGSDMEYGWNSGLLKAADIVRQHIRQHLPIAPAQGGDE